MKKKSTHCDIFDFATLKTNMANFGDIFILFCGNRKNGVVVF